MSVRALQWGALVSDSFASYVYLTLGIPARQRCGSSIGFTMNAYV